MLLVLACLRDGVEQLAARLVAHAWSRRFHASFRGRRHRDTVVCDCPRLSHQVLIHARHQLKVVLGLCGERFAADRVLTALLLDLQRARLFTRLHQRGLTSLLA